MGKIFHPRKKEFSNKPVKELSKKIDKNVSTTKTELPIIVDNHQESMSNSLDMSEYENKLCYQQISY